MTIGHEFAVQWICTCAHNDGFPYSIWLTCLVIKLYCKSFDHNSMCVRACVPVCEHMCMPMCVRFGVCVIHIALYKYECVRQQWTSSTTATTTTTAKPLVAVQWMCVQSKWNRDSDRATESAWWERMVVSKLRKTYRIRRISCICELESLRLYIVERFFISHVAIYLLQSKFILQILFHSFSSPSSSLSPSHTLTPSRYKTV